MITRTDFDTQQWAQDNFADAPLGDQRRSRRLVAVASQISDRPAASTPKIAPLWKDTKALYRLLDTPQVDLQSVTEPHRRRVAARGGKLLLLSDTTHVDFGRRRQVRGAGPVGPGKSVGFLLHSALAYDAQSKSLVGVAGQLAHARRKGRKGRTKASQQGKQWSESRLWSDVFEQVGSPRESTQYIHVCDSAADTYESYFTAIGLGCDCVIRCGRKHRHAVDSGGGKRALSSIARDAPVMGSYLLEIPQGNGRRARSATIEVRLEPIWLPQPRYCSKQIKESSIDGFSLKMVVAREIDPPEGTDPIEWVLLTTLPVESFEEALEVIGYYESRWLVEEWHKAIKTGCSLEQRQHQDLDRLLPLAGIFSVVAVLLIQLRDASRQEPDRRAEEVVPAHWIKMVQAAGQYPRRPKTNRELWHAIAGLGGFLRRKHDGEPGWQTVWAGWQKLHLLLRGAELAKDTA